MAVFGALHDVAEVLAEHISVQLGILNVEPGPPRDVAADSSAGVRITLLYTTPQPEHRNDPWERTMEGSSLPPPLSLTCVYLVTTSGADSDDPIAAHNALGRVMQLFHDHPTLRLPLTESFVSSPASNYTEIGEGPLSVVQIPMVLDQVDKVWTSLDLGLQPWVLYEVGPVQLASLREEVESVALVRPDGIVSLDVRVGGRPVIQRITPSSVSVGGMIRIDASLAGSLDGVRIGGIWVPVSDGSLTALDDGVWVLSFDDGGLETLGEGVHAVTVTASGVVSKGTSIRISAAPQLPMLDAPAMLRHDSSSDLVLTGANLTGAVEAIVWPDGGIGSPLEVHSLGVSGVSDGSVTVPSVGSPGGLSDVGPSVRLWRLAVRVGAHQYTPYVLLELGP